MSKYSPQDIEQSWYARWEENNYFAPSGQGQPFSIAIPPPNVTGTLHMGHAFQHSLVDALVRYKRMQGHNTLWQMGTDHAGISTQMVVTEQLASQGIKPSELGRENFIERSGIGKMNPAALFLANFADLVPPYTGKPRDLPWIRGFHARCLKFLSAFTTRA